MARPMETSIFLPALPEASDALPSPEGIGNYNIEAQGAVWSARRDVIDRASSNLTQSIETIVESCNPKGWLEIETSFDEFNLDLRVSYRALIRIIHERIREFSGSMTNDQSPMTNDGERAERAVKGHH